MATEQYSIGYEEGFQNGWNAAVDSLPAQRKPLTPLEIENLRDEHLYSVHGVIQGHEAFTRAIEAAHGIKGDA